MTKTMDRIVIGMILLGIMLGYLIGNSCNEKTIKTLTKKDTVTQYVTKERPVFIKGDVKIKKILVPSVDTIRITQTIPCDTAFIVQADSVITSTKDTINIAFAHFPKWTGKKSEFSVVFKPRPDSIIMQTVNVPYEVQSSDYSLAWIVSAFVTGIAVGILGTSK